MVNISFSFNLAPLVNKKKIIKKKYKLVPLVLGIANINITLYFSVDESSLKDMNSNREKTDNTETLDTSSSPICLTEKQDLTIDDNS